MIQKKMERKNKRKIMKKKSKFKFNKLFLYITLKNQIHFTYFNFNI